MLTVVVGKYDPKLGRVRTHSDDFYDHRKLVLKMIQQDMAREKATTNRRRRDERPI